MQEINVITPYNLNVPYNYIYDKTLNLSIGDLVIVKVRNKQTYGVIIDYLPTDYNQPLKKVISKIEHIKLTPNLIKFIRWCAQYNMISLGSVLKMTIPIPEILLNNVSKQEIDIFIYNSMNNTTLIEEDLSKQELKVFNIFKKHIKLDSNAIKKLKINKVNLNSLIKKGLIVNSTETFTEDKLYKHNTINTNLHTILNAEQQQVCNKLIDIIKRNIFSVSLLDGVPGSGKTEVYFELISEVIKSGKAVLVLLPEIALSTQWLSRFKKSFEVYPYVWHSSIGKKEKKIIFSDLINGKIKVMVGTRSSLFLPFNNLGLIIVDEEHDSSFKQEDKVIYNARDMTIARASFENIPVLLSTATPSLETWYNCQIGKYNYLQLTKRFNQLPMPTIDLVDMNISNIIKGEILSDYLIKKLITNFNNKRQSLLFLNKRGYSNINICKECKNKIICPKCSHGEENVVYLVAHKIKKIFTCHRCNFWQYLSLDCKVCNTKDSIISYGLGIEKLAEELQSKISEAKIFLASSDTVNNDKKAKMLVQNIVENKVDIIIGTQLLAKGYHFPNLSLVGIVDVGLENNSIDLKSNERIWQVLYQVAGRAGRENIKGEVILQYYNNNYLIQTLINFQRNEFLNKELKDRLENHLPPYTRLGSLIVSSKNEKKLLDVIEKLKKSINLLPQECRKYIKGPVPALFYKINQRYRYRYLITSDKSFNLQKLISTWLSLIKIPSNVSIKADIDPISFY